MQKRLIKIRATTKADLIEKELAATTYLELKEGFPEIEDWDKLKAVVRETRQTLELNEAFLPQGPFTLFLYVKNIKGGSPSQEEVNIYSVWTFSELRKECASREDIYGDKGNYGSYEAMIVKLKESDSTIEGSCKDEPTMIEGSCEDEPTMIDDILDELFEARVGLKVAIEMLKSLPKETDKTLLIKEFEDIKATLNSFDIPGILYS